VRDVVVWIEEHCRQHAGSGYDLMSARRDGGQEVRGAVTPGARPFRRSALGGWAWRGGRRSSCRVVVLQGRGGLRGSADLEPVVAGTEGVTASFVKEMIRRTVLASLRAGERPPVLRDGHFTEVLAGMTGERQALTRTLLGVGAGPGEPPASPGPPVPVRYRRVR